LVKRSIRTDLSAAKAQPIIRTVARSSFMESPFCFLRGNYASGPASGAMVLFVDTGRTGRLFY